VAFSYFGALPSLANAAATIVSGDGDHGLILPKWGRGRAGCRYLCNAAQSRAHGTIGGDERRFDGNQFASASYARRGEWGKAMAKTLSVSATRIGALGLVAMFAAIANAQDTTRQRQGQSIVANKCSSCHAVGRIGESRNPKAPAFRTLHERYPIESLGEALAEGTISGSPDEPEFQFSGREVGAIIS
jgi:cytochrome c